MVVLKIKFKSFFKKNIPKDYGKQTLYGRGKKPSKQKTKSKENIIKSIRNLFRLKKENEVIKGSTIRDVRTLSEQQEDNYYKPIKVGNFWNNNYIEYEINGDRNKNLSVKE